MIKPYLTQYLQGLVTIGFNTNSGETLHLVLQTTSILLQLDSAFTTSVAASICSMATMVILHCPDDPTLFEEALDMFNDLFKIEQCHRLIERQLLPTIVSILSVSPGSSQVQVTFFDASGKVDFKNVSNIISLQPMFLDLLATLVRQAPIPLSDILIQQAYPALITCLKSASKEDTAILQNGSEAVRHFVAKGSEQVITCIDPETNQNGIMRALNVS